MTDFGLSEQHFNLIGKILREFPQVAEIWVYGSRAKGNFTDRSDLDLVIMKGTTDRHIIGKILLEINNSDFPYTVDLQAFDKIKNSRLAEHIRRVGKLFYKRGES